MYLGLWRFLSQVAIKYPVQMVRLKASILLILESFLEIDNMKWCCKDVFISDINSESQRLDNFAARKNQSAGLIYQLNRTPYTINHTSRKTTNTLTFVLGCPYEQRKHRQGITGILASSRRGHQSTSTTLTSEFQVLQL